MHNDFSYTPGQQFLLPRNIYRQLARGGKNIYKCASKTHFTVHKKRSVQSSCDCAKQTAESKILNYRLSNSVRFPTSKTCSFRAEIYGRTSTKKRHVLPQLDVYSRMEQVDLLKHIKSNDKLKKDQDCNTKIKSNCSHKHQI